MITVACVWVQGNVPYAIEYVLRLRSMVKRHLKFADHRFVCLTDRAYLFNDIPDIEAWPITKPPGLAGWWAKLWLFHPACSIGDRVLYLDLDSIIVRDLEPITLSYRENKIALVPDGGTFEGRGHLKVIKRYNSSVMMFRRNPELSKLLWEEWGPEVAGRLWGDQDWIAEQIGNNGILMPKEWFPRISELSGKGPGDDAIVVLSKKPKNHVAAQMFTWVKEAWQ